MTLTFDMTLKFDRLCAVLKVHVHAKYHQAECSSSSVIVHTNFLALSHDGKESKNLVLWPWPLTLKFSGFRAVVKVHVHAKLHPTECSGSWVIVVTEKWTVSTVLVGLQFLLKLLRLIELQHKIQLERTDIHEHRQLGGTTTDTTTTKLLFHNFIQL